MCLSFVNILISIYIDAVDNLLIGVRCMHHYEICQRRQVKDIIVMLFPVLDSD